MRATPAKDGLAPAPPRSRRVSTRNARRGLFFAVTLYASSLLTWTLPLDLVIGDTFLVIVLVAGLPRITTTPLGRRLARRFTKHGYFIVLGSIVALAGIGFTSWAVRTLLQDTYCFVVFLAAVALLLPTDAARTAARALPVVVLLVSVGVLLGSGGSRHTGTFENANYAAHFLAMATLVMLRWEERSRLATWVALAIAGAALVRTGSFGGVLVVAAGVLYLTASTLAASRKWLHLFGVVVLASGCTFLAVEGFAASLDDGESSALSAARLQRSSDLRTEIWRQTLSELAEHPLGIGPYGVVGRGVLDDLVPGSSVEAHSDLIAYLVERGPVATTSLLLLGAFLWRLGPRAGATRVALLAIVVGGLFRETLHFRHLWLLLGLAVALDQLQTGKRPLPDHETSSV